MLSTAVAPGALQAATVSYLADIAQMSEGLDEPGFTVRHQCYSVRLLPPDLVSGRGSRGGMKGDGRARLHCAPPVLLLLPPDLVCGRESQRGEWKGGWAFVPPDVHCHPTYALRGC